MFRSLDHRLFRALGLGGKPGHAAVRVGKENHRPHLGKFSLHQSSLGIQGRPGIGDPTHQILKAGEGRFHHGEGVLVFVFPGGRGVFMGGLGQIQLFAVPFSFRDVQALFPEVTGELIEEIEHVHVLVLPLFDLRLEGRLVEVAQIPGALGGFELLAGDGEVVLRLGEGLAHRHFFAGDFFPGGGQLPEGGVQIFLGLGRGRGQHVPGLWFLRRQHAGGGGGGIGSDGLRGRRVDELCLGSPWLDVCVLGLLGKRRAGGEACEEKTKEDRVAGRG